MTTNYEKVLQDLKRDKSFYNDYAYCWLAEWKCLNNEIQKAEKEYADIVMAKVVRECTAL